MTIPTLTNTDLLTLLNTSFIVDELSVDPETFGEDMEDETLEDEYITIKFDENNVFNIGFNVSIDVTVENSGGDGWNDENFDYISDMNVEVEITDVESVETHDSFDLRSDNLESVLESIVLSKINA